MSGPVFMPQYFVMTWSFVPRNLFNMTSIYSDAFLAENFGTRILIKLNTEVNGTQVAEAIRKLDLEIYGVESLDENYADALEITNAFTFNNLQVLDVQRLGLIFAVLAASVGTALISVVSIKERSREATLMSVRGLSYRQLVLMFLTENIAVITFSIILGLSVGLIIVYGNVTSANAAISELVKRRFVVPVESAVYQNHEFVWLDLKGQSLDSLPAYEPDEYVEKEAWDAAAEVRRGVPFAQVARARSVFEATRDAGGVMGTAARGELDKKIEEAAFKLAIGQVSDPIQTPIGWQVIRVSERVPGAEARYDDVKEDVKQILIEIRRRASYQGMIEELKKKGSIRIHPERFK